MSTYLITSQDGRVHNLKAIQITLLAGPVSPLTVDTTTSTVSGGDGTLITNWAETGRSMWQADTSVINSLQQKLSDSTERLAYCRQASDRFRQAAGSVAPELLSLNNSQRSRAWGADLAAVIAMDIQQQYSSQPGSIPPLLDISWTTSELVHCTHCQCSVIRHVSSGRLKVYKLGRSSTGTLGPLMCELSRPAQATATATVTATSSSSTTVAGPSTNTANTSRPPVPQDWGQLALSLGQDPEKAENAARTLLASFQPSAARYGTSNSQWSSWPSEAGGQQGEVLVQDQGSSGKRRKIDHTYGEDATKIVYEQDTTGIGSFGGEGGTTKAEKDEADILWAIKDESDEEKVIKVES